MPNYESHVSVAGRSENDPEQTSTEQIPETAFKRLERASTIKTVTPTSVSLWDLSKPSRGENQRITRVKLNKPSREYVKGVDHRSKVPREDFGPRGRYRFVCKLVGQYKETQADTHIVALHGTGWLMAKDVVVTAGHVIYDSKDKWGGLTSMKVYIGYNGNDHSHLESRYGRFVAAPTEWIKDLNAKYDVGFIKLNRPFQHVDPVPFMATPAIGRKELIGVVGYPFDLEDGEYMYEHFMCADWNLAMADRNMLEYSIDTYSGQSGAAVLQHSSGACQSASTPHRCQLRAIGVHTYGGEPNEASVIGTAGNVFEDFVLAVKVRNDSTTSARVKVSGSPALSQLPNFSIFTVYPLGSTASRQVTPNFSPRSPRSIASVASDEHLPPDVRKWTKDQRNLIIQQFNAMGLWENSVQNADGKHDEQSDQGLSILRNDDGLIESPKNVDDVDESPVSSTTSWSDLDAT